MAPMEPLLEPRSFRLRPSPPCDRYLCDLSSALEVVLNLRILLFNACALTMAGVAEVSRIRKGKNFTNEEELQVCRSQLSISQDPIVGNGQRKESFWDRVGIHYKRHQPRSGGECKPRSIETKWGVIKHDVGKFVSAYGFVFDNKQSGTCLDDVLRDALELYKD
jgi:hypothetical protein